MRRGPCVAAVRRVIAAGVLSAVTLAGCGKGSVRRPFQADAGEEAGAGGASESDAGLQVGEDAADPTWGGPCADDAQCDDAIACTHDDCDLTQQRCLHTPDSSQCGDEVFCNGEEVCDPRLGCQAGSPVACADSDPCTIDTCVEKTHACLRTARDADGDGDPVWNCMGGGDCDDNDEHVSSGRSEVCDNAKDDNCDGRIDEAKCSRPEHDTCADALLIAESGQSSLSLLATRLDYATECAPAGKNLADIVVALKIPDGPAQDVDVVAQSNGSQLALATAKSCGKAQGVQCSPSVTTPDGALSRLHLFSLRPGVYPLYIAGAQDADVALAVTFSDASLEPVNETCETALPLTPGKSQTASLVSAQVDLTSACASSSGELVYWFQLDQPRDVSVFANPLDSYGVPQVSLRDASCLLARPRPELTCRNGMPSAALFARALPAGRYYLSVAASGPSDVDVRLEESQPTPAPADQGCENAPVLAPNLTLDLTLAEHADAVDVGCLAGAPDSSHRLTLTQSSDVLLVARIANDDTGAVSLLSAACTEQGRLSCGSSSSSPVRAQASAVAPGSYRVLAESAAGDPMSLTAFTRPAVPVQLVAWADDCSAPFEIPPTGGRFQGNTANAHPDFSAGCDVGNQSKNGAADQILHLKLEAKSRVVLDTAGSNYATLLSVRGGAACPGTELKLACAAGYRPQRSFLDLELESGDYYVQIDGYGGEEGAWVLDVYVTPDST